MVESITIALHPENGCTVTVQSEDGRVRERSASQAQEKRLMLMYQSWPDEYKDAYVSGEASGISVGEYTLHRVPFLTQQEYADKYGSNYHQVKKWRQRGHFPSAYKRTRDGRWLVPESHRPIIDNIGGGGRPVKERY